MKELINKAILARGLSYSPYSKFAVGAALLCKDGKVFVGSNVENSSYPLCMCAERNALYNAMMNGYKKDDFVALAIVADTDEPCTFLLSYVKGHAVSAGIKVHLM